jgi:hypothetical protein
MEYYDSIQNDMEENLLFNNKEVLNDSKILDKGHTKVNGYVERADGSLKNVKVDIYTSGFIGSHIRDAETGEYYKELVGSLDEELYFKFKMNTGELKSKNGSTTLFYISPDHCMRHLKIEIPQNMINQWEAKRNGRKREKISKI